MNRRGWLVGGLIVLGSAVAVTAQEKPAATAGHKVVAPEDFLSLRGVSDPEFSPDGTLVAFVVSDASTGNKRTRHIWLYERSGGGVRQITYSEKSESSPRWSPDGKTLAFLSSRDEEQQVYLLNMSGGDAAPLTKGKSSVAKFEWSPDGKSIAYVSPDPKTDAEEKREKDKDDERVVDVDDKQPRLRVITLASRESRALTPATWSVDELVWTTDGSALVVKATDRPASDRMTDRIYRVGLQDAQPHELFAPRGPFGGLQVTPDGKMISFVGSRDDGPEPHDLQVIPAQGGPMKNLTGASLDRAIEDYRWVPSGGLLAVYADGFRRSFVAYTAAMELKDFTPPQPVSAGALSISKTGEVAFVGEGSARPQELWVRDAQGNYTRVTHLNDSWKAFELVALETYKYKSFDGTEIEAGLLKPAGYDGKAKLPFIVLVHGGPTGNWNESIDSWGQLLVARGYVVMYPNIRGSTGYGQKFVEMNRADWGGGDFKDVMAGVDDAIAKGIADPQRLGIGGWSYGGYMSEWAVTQTTRFQAAVSGAGMANLISEFGTEEHPSYDEWFWGTPYEKPQGFLNSSPFLYVKNAKTPTLILQGEADPIDPIGQSQELYRGLKWYGVDAQLVLYPREPHGFTESKHRVDVQARVVAWYEKYLGKPAAAK